MSRNDNGNTWFCGFFQKHLGNKMVIHLFSLSILFKMVIGSSDPRGSFHPASDQELCELLSLISFFVNDPLTAVGKINNGISVS